MAEPGPQRQRRAGRIGLGHEPGLGDRPLEPTDIGVVRVDRQHVARRAGQQDRALRPLRPVGLQRARRPETYTHSELCLSVPPRLAPQLVEDPIGRQHRPGVGQQQRRAAPAGGTRPARPARRPARPRAGRAVGSQCPSRSPRPRRAYASGESPEPSIGRDLKSRLGDEPLVSERPPSTAIVAGRSGEVASKSPRGRREVADPTVRPCDSTR